MGMTVIKYGLEPWDKFLSDGYPLMQDNSKEIDIFGVPLHINRKLYEALDENGVLKCFTIRRDRKLIGYALFIVSNHAHYSSLLAASLVVIYTVPGHRGKGIRLIRHCEERLKELGCDIISQGAPTISRLGGVLEKMGYGKLETIYVKEL